jgi:hypothetical protein
MIANVFSPASLATTRRCGSTPGVTPTTDITTATPLPAPRVATSTAPIGTA